MISIDFPSRGVQAHIALAVRPALPRIERTDKGGWVAADVSRVYFKWTENILRCMEVVTHLNTRKTLFCGWVVQGVELSLSKAVVLARRESRMGGWS